MNKKGITKYNPQSYGCEHYRRKVKFVTPCCKKQYVCRFCHDEKEDHELNRKAIKSIICLICKREQSVQSGNRCCYCSAQFAEYYCALCILYDANKDQYHCFDCGICRIGPQCYYFHCSTCNLCLNVNTIDNHKCVENASKADCPICLEFLHTSRQQLFVGKCGHLMHEHCLKTLQQSEASALLCPVCKLPYKSVEI